MQFLVGEVFLFSIAYAAPKEIRPNIGIEVPLGRTIQFFAVFELSSINSELKLRTGVVYSIKNQLHFPLFNISRVSPDNREKQTVYTIHGIVQNRMSVF